MQQQAIPEGSQLDSVDTSGVWTSNVSRKNDSCCSGSSISYQKFGDDSE